MANKEQLNRLKKSVEEWNKWREENLNEIIDLSYAYLDRADLIDANLNNADLIGTNLNSADLRDANLNSADIRFADLRGANLSYVNLNSADLRFADLRDANLSYADLKDANLRGAIVEFEQLQRAKNVALNFLKSRSVDSDSSRKLEEQLENANKDLEKKELKLKALLDEKTALTDKQKIVKELLQTEVDNLKIESEQKENELKKLKTELTARAKDSEDFKKRLSLASEEIKKPYKYLQYEIWFENSLCVIFLGIVGISFYYLFQFVRHINYDNRILNVYLDKDFNFYKLFFIISPVIFYLGISSTFMTLLFRRRQNVRELESKQQEINHITGILSAYTTIRENEEISHAKTFANEAFKQYLSKIISSSPEKETEEKVDILSTIQDLKAQILELKKG